MQTAASTKTNEPALLKGFWKIPSDIASSDLKSVHVAKMNNTNEPAKSAANPARQIFQTCFLQKDPDPGIFLFDSQTTK